MSDHDQLREALADALRKVPPFEMLALGALLFGDKVFSPAMAADALLSRPAEPCINPHNDTSDPNRHCWHTRETCCHCETSRDVSPRPAEGTGEAVESANDRFERLAEAFYKATGKMAPGKDVPVAIGQDDEAERIAFWRVFRAGVSAAHPPAPAVSEAMVTAAMLAYWTDDVGDDEAARMRNAVTAALAAQGGK